MAKTKRTTTDSKQEDVDLTQPVVRAEPETTFDERTAKQAYEVEEK